MCGRRPPDGRSSRPPLPAWLWPAWPGSRCGSQTRSSALSTSTLPSRGSGRMRTSPWPGCWPTSPPAMWSTPPSCASRSSSASSCRWRRLLLVLLPNLGGPCPSLWDHRIEFAMAQPPSNVHDRPTDLQTGLYPTRLPTRFAADLPSGLPAKSAARPATGWQVRARKHAIRQVVVLEVGGRLSDVVEELDRAIQLALAEGPRGVVCDLSSVLKDAEPVAVELLATAGRHVRDWPGIPVAVACPDPQVREALEAHSLGGHLIVRSSLFSAVTAVLATPTLTVQ